MAPKGGAILFVLIVSCAALDGMADNKPVFKEVKKLMKLCQKKEYPLPSMMLLKTVFNNSDMPIKDRNMDQSENFLSTFMSVLNSMLPVKDSTDRVPPDDIEKMTEMMLNCTRLSKMIRMMKNSSDPSMCYIKKFMASLSYATLTQECVNSDDYDTLLWAAKPNVIGSSSSKLFLPARAESRFEKWMEMLQSLHDLMSEKQRKQVWKWAKEQIIKKNFNCTTKPPADSKTTHMKSCKPSVKWLNKVALMALGRFLSFLPVKDVDSLVKPCDLFSETSEAAFDLMLKPAVAKKLLEKFKECFRGENFTKNVEKLGKLVCWYLPSENLTPDLSKKLLRQIKDCDEDKCPQVKKLKRIISKFLQSNNNKPAPQELGSSLTSLSPRQLFACDGDDIKEALKDLGPNVSWTRGQKRTLVKKCLGDKKCKEVSVQELVGLLSIITAVPSCVFKKIKAKELLGDQEALNRLCKKMRKGQMMAMIQGMRNKNVDPSELVKKLPDPCFQSLPPKLLGKTIKSLKQLEGKTCTESQALTVVKNLFAKTRLIFRNLRPVIKGITCEIIEKCPDSDVMTMVNEMAETPDMLSKVQIRCTARRLFKFLKERKEKYDIDEIPQVFLLLLPPEIVKNLPDSSCPALLEKLQEAGLTSELLPTRSLPFYERTLLCIGKNLTDLTTEDVLQFGPLLCELSPSQLSLLASDVRNSVLEEMASCQQIPRHYTAGLINLITQNYGEPPDWSSETLVMLGPLPLLDNKTISAMRCEDIDSLRYLKPDSPGLKKKIFKCATSNEARRKREVKNSSSSTHTGVITEDMIRDFEGLNVFWSPAELDDINVKTFNDTMETLGDVSGFNDEQLKVLVKKAIQTSDPVSQMTESEIRRLGCIIKGFSDDKLQKLPITQDILEEITHCGWKDSQLELLWRAAVRHDKDIAVQQLEEADLISLNCFICGFNSSEIKQINLDRFRGAVSSINDVHCPRTQQMRELIISAFGNPRDFTAAEVSSLGNFIAQLSADEFASLKPPLMSYFRPSSIPLIPPKSFARLSVDQLRALGPDSADMVTREQQALLSKDQLSALNSVKEGTDDQTSKPPQAGAPSLTTEGSLSFTKPLLFLLMGFLLL
ncbi:otoancorin [Cheilinus undulatus]|uniref:otoancorin n=1 Tax=Cheilinus undulatus TaxID=241271 RepID=UPI001BD68A93|nr:otoancorin [Cheilinus undulatus]